MASIQPSGATSSHFFGPGAKDTNVTVSPFMLNGGGGMGAAVVDLTSRRGECRFPHVGVYVRHPVES